MKKYDLAIIGSGPGGYTAGILAGQKGLNVCIIEKESLGGTCLNWGCIPTKSLSESAHLFSRIKKSKEFGINIDNASLDFNQVISRKDRIVQSLHKGIQTLCDANKIDIIHDKAVLGEKK